MQMCSDLRDSVIVSLIDLYCCASQGESIFFNAVKKQHLEVIKALRNCDYGITDSVSLRYFPLVLYNLHISINIVFTALRACDLHDLA